MTDMNFDEAVQVASRMKGRFKAFQKLEQVIDAARMANQEIGEKEKRVAELRAAVAGLEEQRDTVEARLDEAADTLAQRLEEADKQSAAIIADGEKQLHERLVFIQHQVKAEEDDLKAAAATAGAFRTETEQERRTLEGEISELQGTLASLRSTARKVAGL